MRSMVYHVGLPDFADGDEAGSSSLNPYLDPDSSSALASTVVVRGKPAGEGVLTLGLSRQEAGGWGPWRWQELRTDASGRVMSFGAGSPALRLLSNIKDAAFPSTMPRRH